MCEIQTYKHTKRTSYGSVRSWVAKPITDTSIKDLLKYSCFSINFIDSCLKSLKDNYIWHCQ